MMKAQKLLAENDRLTPESRCPKCKGKSLTTSKVTFTDRSKAILQSCEDCGWLEGEDNGFRNVKIFKEEDPLSPENRVRVNRLTADFDIHFGKHFVDRKLVQFDKNCSFCEAYDTKKETISNSESHQSYKKTWRAEE